MAKGKCIRSRENEIIYNVHQYFQRQSKEQKTPPKLCEKTAQATGFTKRSVYRVLSEKRVLGDDIAFPSPKKRYSKSKETVDIDNFDVDAIRRTVHEFYDKKE